MYDPFSELHPHYLRTLRTIEWRSPHRFCRLPWLVWTFFPDFIQVCRLLGLFRGFLFLPDSFQAFLLPELSLHTL